MLSATLKDLPAELIGHIAAYLEDEDARTIRLTSRYLERASHTYFGKHFFRKKGFMITSPSLGVLQDIASHPELHKYVEHIWFNPDCFLFAPLECLPEEIYDDGGEYDDEGNGVRYNVESLSRIDRARWHAYCAVLEDHRQLMVADHLEQRLTRALRTLPNLEVIGMRRSEDHRPWGWKTLTDAVGQDPRQLGPIPSGPMWNLSGPTKLFLAIINAVASTEVRLKRLYTDAIEVDNIRPDLLSQSTLDRACHSLLYLELNCSKAWLNSRNASEDYITLHDTSSWGRNLLRILRAVPQLRELGLQIFPDRKQRFMVSPSAADPNSWRRSYAYICFALLAEHAPLAHLTRVKLEKFTTSPDILQSFLQPCAPHLSSLKIRDMRLLATGGEQPRPWEPVFSFLATTCTRLTYVLMFHLLHDTGGVSFTEDAPQQVMRTTHPLERHQPTVEGHPPPAIPTDELFSKYEHIVFEARGTPAVVREAVSAVVEAHWYQRPIFSYTMDEDLWHTDTSDEEW